MLRQEKWKLCWYFPKSCHHHFRDKGSPLVNPSLNRIYRNLVPRLMSTRSLSQFSEVLPNESVEYGWIDGVERLDMYTPGGYHPVMINDLLCDRYRVVDKLGFGGYSTIWLARDYQLNRYVAIKVNVSNSLLPRRESSILRALSSSKSTSKANDTTTGAFIPRILDEFDIKGPNGTHSCYIVAPAQGNLKEASFSRLFPVEVARSLAARLALAVSFVHSQGFVHGGLFPPSVKYTWS
jgi:serine/threonine-protein kinase SRPK3